MKTIITKLKTVFQFVLAGIMIFPTSLLLPVQSVLAASLDTSVQNSPNVELADGTILGKTVEPVANMVNQWKVTLRVEAKKTQKTSDTILVIDRSGSMGDNNRLKEAKEAAKKLVDMLLTAGNTTNKVAIISFASEVTTDLGFTTNNQAAKTAINAIIAKGGTFTQAGIRQARNMMNLSTADFKNIILLSDGEPTFSYGITNPDNYLSPQYIGTASYTIGASNYSETINDYRKATTTAIPATEFTNSRVGSGSQMFHRYENHSGANNDKYYNHGNSAIAEAGFYKTAGIGNLYTIALEAGSNGTPVLNQMATPGKSYTATPSELNAIFTEIAGSISSAVQDATITDTMGDGVVAVQVLSGNEVVLPGNGKSLTWNLGTPTEQENGKFVAEMSYLIELDENILTAENQGGFYPANTEAKITYNGNETGLFPVPKINPVFIKLTKQLEGQTCAGCKFTLSMNGPDSSSYDLQPNQPLTLFSPMKVGNYTVAETDTMNNDLTLAQYLKEYTGENFNLTQTSSDHEVIVKNIHETVDVSVQKVWTGKQEPSAKIRLVTNNTPGDPIEVNPSNNWRHIFSGLSKLDKNGNENNYSIQEVEIPNYTSSVTGSTTDGFTVTNTYVSPKINITATKKWQNGPALRPAIQLELLRDGVRVGELKTLEGGVYTEKSVTWTGLDENDANGNPYDYTVREVGAMANYIASYEGYTITNSYEIPTVDKITATKTWVNGNNLNNGVRPTVWFKLYRQLATAGPEAVPGVELQELENGDTVAEWTNLEKTDLEGNEYTFSVKEVDANGNEGFVPANYEKSGEGTLNITNTYHSPKLQLKFIKTWQGGLATDHQEVTIKLLRNSVFYKDIRLNQFNNYTLTIEEDKTDENGVDYRYSVEESNIATNIGVFSPSIDLVSTATGIEFDIINKFESNKINIPVQKIWIDGDNIDGLRPEKVTIELVKNADVVSTLDLTANSTDDNCFSWCDHFADIPAYEDADGSAITYTVREISTPGYTSQVSGDQTAGFSVTNTHDIQTTSISFQKNWVDNDNQDGKRQNTVVHLLADGAMVDSKQIDTTDKAYTFADLPLCSSYTVAGTEAICNEISYSIAEDAVDGYMTEITGDAKSGFTVTNSHTPETISVPVQKIWVDEDDIDGLRPSRILVRIVGGTTSRTLGITTHDTTPTCESWCNTFTDLPKYHNGELVNYALDEIGDPGYTTEITGNQDDGFTITNTHIVERFDLNFKKVWVDNGRSDLRAVMTVRLIADGRTVDEQEITTVDQAYSFEGLPVCDGYDYDEITDEFTCRKISYDIKEVLSNPRYSASYSEDEDGVITITNTYLPPVVPTTPNTGIEEKTASLSKNNISGLALALITVFSIFNLSVALSTKKRK